MSYSVLGKDDENLRVTVTEGSEQTVISIQPAALTIIGAVTSVNGQTGAVTVTEGLTQSEVDARVQLQIDGLIDGAPGTLDTLNELAAALNDDEAAYDTLNNLISTNSSNISLKLNTSDFTTTADTWLDTKATADVTFGSVTAQMYGASHLNVKNDSGVTITKGTPVYFKGISGTNITVGIADANDPNKMPAFGIADADANNNAELDIITHGELVGLDTSAYAVNDDLYVSTTGTLTPTRPTGADDAIQKIAYVARVHATEGRLYIMGAGRSNDIPNLSTGHVFIGNGSGYEKRALTEADISDLSHFSGDYNDLTNTPTIPTVPTNISEFTNDSGYITSSIGAHLIPDTNVTYDLGSATNRFRDLYLSGSSIDLGGATITSDGSAIQLPAGSSVGGVEAFSGDYNDLTNLPTLFDGDYNSLTNTPNLYDLTLPSQELWTLTSNYSAAGQDMSATAKNLPVNLGALSAFYPAVSDMYMAFSIGTDGGNNVLRAVAKGTDDGTHDGVAIIHGANNAIYSWANSGFSFNPLEIKSTGTTISMDDNGTTNNDALFVKTFGTPDNNDETRIRIGFQDGATFKEGGTIATMFQDDGTWEFKFQGIDPTNTDNFNNLTIRKNYIYSDNPFLMTNYSTTELGSFVDPGEGMLVWDYTAGSLKVYDGTAWSGVGGGGASELNGLSDVNITSVADGDLLRYNGTASEWQNTNLGISVTPTLNVYDSFFSGTEIRVVISNHSTYDDPHYFCELYDSSNVLQVSNANITVEGNEVVIAAADMPAVGNDYELRVKVQDFGDIESEVATTTFDILAFGGSGRFWRLQNFTTAEGLQTMITGFQLYSGSGQTGTVYGNNNTSASSPYPIDSDPVGFSGYEAYKAFDGSNSTAWWSLGSTSVPADEWIEIDLNAVYSVSSIKIIQGSHAGSKITNCDLAFSSSGAFAGEETVISLTLDEQANFGENDIG